MYNSKTTNPAAVTRDKREAPKMEWLHVDEIKNYDDSFLAKLVCLSSPLVCG